MKQQQLSQAEIAKINHLKGNKETSSLQTGTKKKSRARLIWFHLFYILWLI